MAGAPEPLPFAIAALLMTFDFLIKLGPMFLQLSQRLAARTGTRAAE